MSVGQQALDPLFLRVISQCVAGASVPLHRYGDLQSCAPLCILNRNSYRVVGLASERKIRLNGLSGFELNRAGRGEIGDAGKVNRRITILLAAGNGGGGIV